MARSGRRGGLDGADTQAVGRVLQGLQLLLIRLMVGLHGAARRTGGWRGLVVLVYVVLFFEK